MLSKISFSVSEYDLSGFGTIKRKVVKVRPLFNIFNFSINFLVAMLLAGMIK